MCVGGHAVAHGRHRRGVGARLRPNKAEAAEAGVKGGGRSLPGCARARVLVGSAVLHARSTKRGQADTPVQKVGGEWVIGG